MTNGISKAKIILHEEGLLALLKQFLLLIIVKLWVYSSYDIYMSDLDPLQFTPKVDNIDIRMITSTKEIQELESTKLTEEGFNFIRNKEIVNKGAILFYAMAGNDLAHVTQIFIGRRAHDIYPFSFAMPYGHVVGLAGFTTPKYRGKGIHVYSRSQMLQFLKERRFSRAWDVYNRDNVAARNSVLKLGSYLWGVGHRLRLLSLVTIEWTTPESQVLPSKIRCLFR